MPTEELLGAFATNNRINLYLIENLPAEVWDAKPPKGRTIAAIVAHIHNVRLMWLNAAGAKELPEKKALPEKLDANAVTKEQAAGALQASAAALEEVLKHSLETDGKVKGFKPDVHSFFAYLIAHDAHHRGQITMLARQLGHAVSQKTMFGMWEWGTR